MSSDYASESRKLVHDSHLRISKNKTESRLAERTGILLLTPSMNALEAKCMLLQENQKEHIRANGLLV